MKDKRLGYVLGLCILVVVYFLTARLGLSLNAVSGFATLVWPPTGIALAVVLLFGYRLWPGIAFAAFLVNWVTGASPLVAAGIALGNTLEALAGAYLLDRLLHFRRTLDRLSDVLGLICLAGVIATLVSACIGVLSLWLGGVVRTAAIGQTWLAWWIGDMLGALIVAPLILVWAKQPWPKVSMTKVVEASALAVLLVVASAVEFRGIPTWGIGQMTLTYLIFPILIWVALRFGLRGSVTAGFVVTVIAVWGTIATAKAASAGDLSVRLLLVQGFMGVTAVTFMVMAAIVAEVLRRQRQTVLLTKQRAQLIALNKSKNEFISLASHQLRTPATAVKLYISMLLDNYAGRLTKAQRELLQTAYDSNERQLLVANCLLDVARIDSGTINLDKEPVDLRKLICQIIKDVSITTTERGQSITLQPAKGKAVYSVPCDKTMLGMALENIIVNASNYSHTGKNITILLSQAKGRVEIAVKDQGVGIPKTEYKKLFRKFTRLDNALSTDAGGMGLGLYWSKKVVELHGGTISVVSEPAVGSTFTIALPLKPA